MNLAFFKKYLVLEIGGAVILAALVVVGVKLWAAARHYAGEKSALQAVTGRKQQLDLRDPYPSLENVKQEAENFKDILDNYNELNEMLRAQQIEPQAMPPADFMPLLENTLRRLRNMLAGARVAYPPKYAFGFDRYVEGKMPAAADVPGLVQQLRIIEELCRVLCRVGVVELASIAREEFEAAGRPEPGAWRSAPAPESAAPPPRADNQWADDELYAARDFTLKVKAGEAVVFDLLNLLARLPMFTVVTWVEIMVETPKPPLPAASAAAPTTPKAAAELVSERKVILGRELVDLTLKLDVYQFAPALDFKESAKKK